MESTSLEATCAGLGRWLEEHARRVSRPGPRARVTAARGCAGTLLLADALVAARRPALVLAPDGETAEGIAADLRFFAGESATATPTERRVHYFPGWEVPPFDEVSPAREVTAARMAGLFHLVQTASVILVTTPEALLQRVMPRGAGRDAWLYLVRGDTPRMEDVAAYLDRWGYYRVPAVQDLGEYALRGGILDIHPGGYVDPIRLEFVGDTIEGIRDFDPATQRSGRAREDVLLLPVQEYDGTRLPGSVRVVEDRAAELGLGRRERHRWTEALEVGFHLPGAEFLLPYFYERLDTIGAYLPADTTVWLVDPIAVAEAARAATEELGRRAAEMANGALPAPPPEALYLSAGDLQALLDAMPVVEVESLETPAPIDGRPCWRLDSASNRGLAVAPGRRERAPSLGPLAERLRAWRETGLGIVVVMSGRPQADRLQQLLAAHGIALAVGADGFAAARAWCRGDLERVARGAPRAQDGIVVCGDLSAGVQLPADRLVVLTEEEIFGERRAARRARPTAATAAFLTSLAELKPEDYVVHLDHGIGLYRGLRHLQVASTQGDYLHIEYAGGDRLYLPVDRINLVQRYLGSDGKPPALDKLGGTSWERVKKKAHDSILSMARELLQIEAAREVVETKPCSPPDGYFGEFEARFPYEETPGQRTAIEDVLADMQRPKPMDRLVCGDVGYGKTEVALRAAFLAVMDGSQAAVLVPTTVLAHQHLATFGQRFAGYPVRIEMLSRFRSAKENRATIAGLAAGAVDVVIGTHRLLQKDVQFRKLGLLVVDEEHRFGVADKERIKRLRTEVDVLTLTATPIPRTLQMSLSGIRDLSVIETPPLDRLAVRTYLARFEEHVVRDAILRELRRGGQVFFVHNRVETIDQMAQWVTRLVPEARIAVGHGQLRERELERVMHDFIAGDTNVLVCSTIIESGLDIPRVNTIVINRADTFGLAQLYQLRGRVGRSHQRAYAYLLIPGEQLISHDAKKRLRVLQELDDLGSGFRLAAQDLEIRGAGNLLGRQQSGHIAAIGLELYMRMLEDVVLEVRGGTRRVEVEPEVQLDTPAFIPEAYVPDASQRLVLYKRLASVRTGEEVADLAAEMQDRFGPLPPQADTLVQIMDFRRYLKDALVTRVRRRGDQLLFEFHPDTCVDAERFAATIRRGGDRCRMVGQYQLSFSARAGDVDGMLQESRDLLRSLMTAT